MEENCYYDEPIGTRNVENEENLLQIPDSLTDYCCGPIKERGILTEQNTEDYINDSDPHDLNKNCMYSNDSERMRSNESSVNELIFLKDQNKALQTDIDNLQKENARLEADRSADLYSIQLEGLERTISLQKNQIQELKYCLKEQESISQKCMLQMKQEYEYEIEKVNKKYEIVNKERESMVMKYAVSEKSVIDLKRALQSMDVKMKDLLKEKEAVQIKVKTVTAEKMKLQQLIDIKVNEIALLEKEHQKRKDDIQMKDSKIIWTQNRLKSEMDNHAETQSKFVKLQQKFKEAKEEAEQFKKHAQTLIKNYQEAQEEKNNQEQEEKAKLIIDKHDEEMVARLQQEHENLKKKQKNFVDENNHLSLKIQSLEKERLEFEQNLSKMKQAVDTEKLAVIDLLSQLTDFESTKSLLQHERERLTACQMEMDRLRISNMDLQQEIQSCRERETELLEFTQKLTEKNVELQSEFTVVEATAHQLQMDHSTCNSDISQLECTINSLTEELEREKNKHQEDKEILTKRLSEQNKKYNSLAQELTDQQGENQLLKKKHVVALKELSKELNICRKNLELYENSNINASLGENSRTSSTASLNTVETNENKMVINNQDSPLNSPVVPLDLDPQILISKIIEVQKSNARKSEKLEFLKEHVKQLVAELQKKTRIIQNYILREQAGALSSDSMDSYKSVEGNCDNYKAAVSKHGGIMASVYNSKAADEGMTLEFSLRINRKLQAVLEDTLLKNIMLKENIETLGNEIARLTVCEVAKQHS